MGLQAIRLRWATPADAAGIPPGETLCGTLLAEGRGNRGREGAGGREAVRARHCEESGSAEARDAVGVGQGRSGGSVPHSGKGLGLYALQDVAP